MTSLDELNQIQRAAVEAPDGPVMIMAGPGTGKTKSLTGRLAYLLKTRRYTPEALLALTFTNKAASELRERLQALLPGRKLPTVATFHSLAYQLLGELSNKKTQIVPEVERTAIIAELKKARKLKATTRELSLLISNAKNTTALADGDVKQLLASYNAELALHGVQDFDDLLLRLYKLLQTDAANEKLQKRYRSILVDEFQDTNGLQYELLKLLRPDGNIFVIGDPRQSIYGFRGATDDVFDRFKSDWPTAQVVTLSTNYRSTTAVVKLAGAIFSDAPEFRAVRADTGQVRSVEVLNDYSEARWVIDQIERIIGGSTMLKGGDHQTTAELECTFRDFAVLYRSHAVTKSLQKCLEDSGIPYQVAGEGSPYERPAVATILSCLRYLIDGELPSVATITSVQQQASRLIEALGLLTDKNQHDLQEFLNSLLRFDDLTSYLAYVDSIAEQAFYDPAADAVTLLTIHASKGLEFKHVFLIGAEEGLLPHLRSGSDKANLDEERCLFYVAVTRTRDKLDILHARSRGGKPAKPSRFICDLPTSVLERIIDPDLATQQRKQNLRRLKRSQGTLF